MFRLLRRMHDETGASLTELSAVVTILGGVSAVAVVALSPLSADAVSVACRANQETVRMAAMSYETQSPLGTFPSSIRELVAGGYLESVPVDVSYTLTWTSFEIRGTGPCAT